MGYPWSMRRPTRWIIGAIVVALLVAAVAVAGVLWAKSVQTAAATGRAQAAAGVKSLAAQDATAAASQFAAASRTFASAKRSLGPEWFVGVVKTVPYAGRQYRAAQSLVEIGLDGSKAGAELAQALRESSASAAATSPAGKFAVLLGSGRHNVEAALAALSDAEDRAAGLPADGLLPPLAKAVTSVKATLGEAAPFLARSHALLDMESYLFSGNHRLLVVSQDGAELRPTGGFAGSFGLIDVGSTGVRLEAYEDVYVLPDPPGIVPPPAGAFMTKDFGFRDANWWLDFPTSARAMLGFWRTYQQPQVDGLIAIDTVAMKSLLAATGPVHVPNYGETFTAANLLGRLLYLVEVEGAGRSDRKGVLTALATQLEARMLGAGPAELAKSAMVLGTAADAKHVQLYFTDPHVEAAVQSLGWSGQVAPPSGTTDVLAVSDAMNRGSKVNIAMYKNIDYQVELRPDYSAETTLALSYANTGPYPMTTRTIFGDWLRVYRAPGTVLPSAGPSGEKTVTTEEFGFPAEVRQLSLHRGQSRVETLSARVPDALRADAGQAGASGGGLHYQLHVVRQDDLVDVPLSVTVTAPPGWRVAGASARLTASGKALPTAVAGDRAHLAIPLSGDIDLTVELASN